MAPSARAALDPELTKPYRLEVVVRVARHNMLTDLFRDQVERQLGDSLRAALGDLASVAVLRSHPRLAAVEERGLDKALDGWTDVTGTKTHFVLIDFQDGEYVIRARQHDGLTGQPSPVVREERTTDREFVARTAALLVDRDFGLVGTVTDKRDGQTVTVTFKGGGLGVPLDRWVKKGEVFALVHMSQAGAGQRAVRVPWAVLRVKDEPHNGTAACQLFNRFQNPLGGPSVAGVRCLKLNTLEKQPLRLRLVQSTDRGVVPAPTGLQVEVRRDSFRGNEANVARPPVDSSGYLDTERNSYDHLALVSIVQDGRVTLVPVPMVDDQPMLCSITVSGDTGPPLHLRRGLWLQDIYTSFQVQNELFRTLQAMLKQPGQRGQALERARAGLKDLDRDLNNFARERKELDDAVKATPRAPRIDFTEGDRVIVELGKAKVNLQDFVTSLDKAIKEENDPKVKEVDAKIQQGQLEETNAEFGKAIVLYEEALAAGVLKDPTRLKEHLAALKGKWQEKGAAHAEARKFIYETWPTLDLIKTKDAIDRARTAFEACKAAGDKLAPQKLLKVALSHAGKLDEKARGLQPDINADDLVAAQAIEKVVEPLKKLMEDVSEFLK